MNLHEELSLQLDILHRNTTKDEWLAFCLAYYERLSIKEICLVLSLDDVHVNMLIDNALYKAVNILGNNMKYLSI